MRVLIIEDNSDIVANLYSFLQPLGYELDWARSGTAGLARAATGAYDAIVLDLMLPGVDGLELCRKLRMEMRRATPVLMLTARDTVEDKVAGFESGADDYLIKPFSMVELDARLKALVRRAANRHVDTVMCFGDVRFDPSALILTRSGKRIELTRTGYKLVACLLRAAPGVVPREALEYEIWGDAPPDSDALRTHVHAVRQALDKPFPVPIVKTVPGVGYRLDPDA